ncbi:glucuronyl hydrolase [Sandaracinomonas limnophila]|uniref:Glucuronyl hydrolase n=1 Tax=Sandaracinomonas limnophila TaxID=1862386 RepID=A0A437PR50_9BACT|nr:glycoside hydrolase family 88 protein [Sandaracinomonas limnophila]RVU24742.1 glucuronyl hydrolase [Sandaracinomonas limnophila]
MKPISFLFAFLISTSLFAQKIDIKAQYALAEKQYEQMLKDHPDTSTTVHSAKQDGTYRNLPSSWWCSGFFPGGLWYLFEQTKNPKWEKAARLWSAAVEKEKYNTGTHDLGFMMYCSFGNGLRLAKDPKYKAVLIQSAKSLATRFDPKIGLIKSWNSFKGGYKYPVIIDNMMNLELLFWAARETGDKSFYDIAIKHADNTIKNHFRPDFSSYHVICYGPNGEVLAKKQHQGYVDESQWSRGHAWAIYGYVMMYRETKDKKYLDFAQKITDYYLNHPNLPKDKIPYWDFYAPNIPNEERDASAGAIVSSALFELGKQTGGEKGKQYIKDGITMLESLSSPAYRAALGENNNFLIKHCVGAKSLNSEIDVPLIYADYYYLEALKRYQEYRKKGM